MTGGTTLVSAMVLYLYGGPAIQPFAFTFIVGLLAGTVSSVVIAAPMTYFKGQDHPVFGLASRLRRGRQPHSGIVSFHGRFFQILDMEVQQ